MYVVYFEYFKKKNKNFFLRNSTEMEVQLINKRWA